MAPKRPTAGVGSHCSPARAIMQTPMTQITWRMGTPKPNDQPKLTTVISRKMSQSPRRMSARVSVAASLRCRCR
jgi:hypothetical protein